MRKLLNTLYVTTDTSYLALDGETVSVQFEDGQSTAIPLHTLENIVCFSYKGASPALMGKCAQMNIGMFFYTPHGRFLASVSSGTNGNVLLRREQYRIADNASDSIKISKNMLLSKMYNSKSVVSRCLRDHQLQVDTIKLSSAAEIIQNCISQMKNAESDDEMRGIEGVAASAYFGVFNEFVLRNKECFAFETRNRRPPTDNINAILSFSYSLMTNDCASALSSVGLDPYVGFFHTDKPGRKSLALDLVEEFRSVYADRFALTLINNRVLNGNDFERQETGAVRLNDEARKKFLSEWQKRKKEVIIHPYLEEKVPWGLVPYVQSLLLARYIRGDLEQYPSFFWK